MSVTRDEAFVVCRRMVRTLRGAPNPRRQVAQIVATLSETHGWTRQQKSEIDAFVAWIADNPPENALKPHCEALLAKLG